MEVQIRNKDFLATLNHFKDEFFKVDGYEDPKYFMYSSEEDRQNGQYLTSEEFLREVSLKGDPVGPPDRHYAQPIASMVRRDPEVWSSYMNMVKYEFASEIGAHTSALLSYYPPGGFVGWHTNWDATAYQVLFTWSEGDGYFTYYDIKKDEVVTIPDVPGWQCRHYYFGPKEEPDNLCWHAAYAGGKRITLAYKFCGYGENDPRDEKARQLRDMLIEEIESD
jgi:hypothetical protein